MYLYGAGGHAKVIIDILKSQGKELSWFIDDNELITEILGYKVFHHQTNSSPFIVSIGNNKWRKEIVSQLSNAKFETAVHSSAIISDNSQIEEGTVVMQGSIIQSGAVIGKHCIINTGASVDHDCRLGDFVHMSPRATLCGIVTIGEGSLIGAGAVVLNGITVGKWCVIGAGSVVTKDIPDYAVAVGVPCKVIKKNEV